MVTPSYLMALMKYPPPPDAGLAFLTAWRGPPRSSDSPSPGGPIQGPSWPKDLQRVSEALKPQRRSSGGARWSRISPVSAIFRGSHAEKGRDVLLVRQVQRKQHTGRVAIGGPGKTRKDALMSSPLKKMEWLRIKATSNPE